MPAAGASRGPPPPPSRDNKPANASLPPVTSERGNLLASIRAGTQLKKVDDESARGASPPTDENMDMDGMAGALARALLQRNNVIQRSGE